MQSLDQSLDEILADRQKKNSSRGGRGPRNGGGGGSGNRRRERERDNYPRDGVRKSYRDDQPRNLDSEWVHDRYDDNDSRRGRNQRREVENPDQGHENPRGTKIRVENIHYELTEEDLEGLFSRIGPISSMKLLYDRSGRSEGIAYVVYESYKDATTAVKEFDGANAAGQPIRLSIVQSNASTRRNPFDGALRPGRPLSERITQPRARSLSPGDDARRHRIDRYVPGRSSRSRSPPSRAPRRDNGGRRPGARRGGWGRRDGGGGSEEPQPRGGRDGRPKKTQEELDAEMDNYFGGGGGGAATEADGNAKEAYQAGPGDDDIDMIS